MWNHAFYISNHLACMLMFGIFYPIVKVAFDENASDAKYCKYF